MIYMELPSLIPELEETSNETWLSLNFTLYSGFQATGAELYNKS